MIVIGMCPTGSVYLTGRNTYRTKGGNGKGRLLTTTAISRLNGSKRRAGTSIARTVNHLFMTPVIYLQNGIPHGKILDTLLQFIIKYPAGIIQILIIHPDWKYKMPEYIFGNRFSPRHLTLCLLSQTYILQIIISRIVGNITNRHIGIKEHQCFTLYGSKRGIPENTEQIAVWKLQLLHCKVSLYLVTISLVLQKMLFRTRKKHKKQ